MPLSSITCAGCNQPLLSVTGGHLTPDLELWLGNFCPSCKRVFCKECLDDWIGFHPPCPHCGERTYPAARHLMEQSGVLKAEAGERM